jgi:alpha/beta superfamily hydrolase
MMEEAVSFGPAGALQGVVTLPKGDDKTEWGVVLLNAGVVHRVGPNRLYVQLARSLAPHDFTTLRFDFSNVGDSPGREDNVPFERRAVEEVRHAMDWLSNEHGCRKFALMGVCSGAEVAPRPPAIRGSGPPWQCAPTTLEGADASRRAHLTRPTLLGAASRQRWLKLLKWT